MKIKIDFPSIQTRLSEDEIELVANAIRDATTFSMGKCLKEFEDNFSKYIGTKYCFGVNNATAALEIAAILSKVKEGDEVILPAHTFTATALPFLRRNATLVFADIEPDTFLMDLNDVERKITDRTKVIVPVHLYGLPVDMEKVMELSIKRNIFIVEDCAQSIGGEVNKKKVGTFGHISCFSFHSQKNITTLGEGGMIATNLDEFYEQILGLRKIGSRPFKNQEKYWIPAMSNIVEAIPGELPFNFALPEINAFAGNLILKRYDALLAKRNEIARKIIQGLKDFPELEFQRVPKNRRSAYHLLPARFRSTKDQIGRNELIELLFSEFGIKCVVQYLPLYRYELFINNGYSSKVCPESDLFFDNMISFPFGTDLETDHVEYMIESIKKSLLIIRNK
jgi:perosamine synthetase